MSFFNSIAATYDSWYKTPLGRFVDEVETHLAFKFFNPEKGMKILDVGCGTGNFSIKLARMGACVTGIDISDKMLLIAKEKAKEMGLDIIFERMDVYDIAFPNNYFDGVFSMAAFEFIKQPQRAFKEMMRVLKPGGQLLIGTIHKDSTWGALYEKQAQQDPDSIFRFADFKTLEDLENLDRKNLVKSGQCLFIPPDASPEGLNWKEEERLSKTEKGGFIIALWKKPL